MLWKIPTGIPITPIPKYQKEISVCFLGTSSATPTSTRSTSSLGIKLGSDTLWIFDCGDGTVRQLLSSPIALLRPSVIFITHLHEDHFLGLPALVKLCQEKVTVVGPLGIYDLLSPFLNAYDMKRQVSFVEIVPAEKTPPSNFKSNAMHRYVCPSSVESSTYVAYQDQDFAVIAMPIKHSTFCLGYVIFEKAHSLACVPRKISILGDTSHPWSILQLARYSDALIHECTFLGCERLRAEMTMHSTTSMAGAFAKAVAPRALYLNHFSKRYFLYEIENLHNNDPHTELLLAEVRAAMGLPPVITEDDPVVLPVKDLQSYRIPSRSAKDFLKFVTADSMRNCTENTAPEHPVYPFVRMPRKDPCTAESSMLLMDLKD
ncbi:hypothetical protein MDAP_001428 [Mitosporidium daphniae]